MNSKGSGNHPMRIAKKKKKSEDSIRNVCGNIKKPIFTLS